MKGSSWRLATVRADASTATSFVEMGLRRARRAAAHEADSLRAQVEQLRAVQERTEGQGKQQVEAVLEREAETKRALEAKLSERSKEMQAARGSVEAYGESQWP